MVLSTYSGTRGATAQQTNILLTAPAVSISSSDAAKDYKVHFMTDSFSFYDLLTTASFNKSVLTGVLGTFLLELYNYNSGAITTVTQESASTS